VGVLLCYQVVVCAIDNIRITKSEHLFLNLNCTSELYRGLVLTNYFRGIVNNTYNEYTTRHAYVKGSYPIILYDY